MYGIKKVSEMLGISTVTLRAWENRFKIINPIRGHGGHRLYSEANIETLKWLKHQLDKNNLKISEAVTLLKQRATANSAELDQALPGLSIYDDFIERLYQELVHLNMIQAHETIDLAFSLYDYVDVFHNILVRVLYRMGVEWENGEITAAQEHFASQLIMQRFIQFYRILPIQPNLPKALALCPEGEHHHLGLMLLSLFLRKKGLEVIYLGPNTPLNELEFLIKLKNISIVAVSITDPKLTEGLETWIDIWQKEFPLLKIILGGTGFQISSARLSTYVLSNELAGWEKWYHSEIKAAQTTDTSHMNMNFTAN